MRASSPLLRCIPNVPDAAIRPFLKTCKVCIDLVVAELLTLAIRQSELPRFLPRRHTLFDFSRISRFNEPRVPRHCKRFRRGQEKYLSNKPQSWVLHYYHTDLDQTDAVPPKILRRSKECDIGIQRWKVHNYSCDAALFCVPQIERRMATVLADTITASRSDLLQLWLGYLHGLGPPARRQRTAFPAALLTLVLLYSLSHRPRPAMHVADLCHLSI